MCRELVFKYLFVKTTKVSRNFFYAKYDWPAVVMCRCDDKHHIAFLERDLKTGPLSLVLDDWLFSTLSASFIFFLSPR